MIQVFILFCVIKTDAQRDFRPGYIISKNSDTIRGYLLYRTVNASQECSFKKQQDEKQSDYWPTDILGFRFDEGKYFTAKEIPLENGPKWVFVEFLIKGKASIYFMRDGTDHYFIEKDNDRIVELTEKQQVISGEDGKLFVKPEQYTGKLKSVLSDCQDIFPEIDRTNLNHSSLIRLARDYHTKVCASEECIVFERKKKPVRLHFGVYGGYTLNKMKFGALLTIKDVSNNVIAKGNQLVSGYSSGGLLGCRLEAGNIFSPNENASLLIDIVFQGFFNYRLTETGDRDYITYNGHDYNLSQVEEMMYQKSLDINLKTLAIKIPLMFNQTFFKGVIRPYIGLGVLNMFIVSQNTDFKLLRFTAEFGKSIPVYHVGFIGAAGARVMLNENHFLFFDLGYEFTQSTNVRPDLRLINSLFEFKLGYSL